MEKLTPQDHFFLQRSLDLAKLGGIRTAPNPRVGAVVVHQGRILGEGYHEYFGGPHAEVNAVNAVASASLLAESTIYVSLEPCNHQGKTPACTGLILNHQIPRVVIGSLDPNPQMAGKSVAMLRNNGVEVAVAAENQKFISINRHFWVNQMRKRAYITLKWAQSQDGFISGLTQTGTPLPVAISGKLNKYWVHSLRASHAAILVGSQTVLIDSPSLTTRLFPGPDPVKLILDPELEIPEDHEIFRSGTTYVLNQHKTKITDFGGWIQYPFPFDLEQIASDMLENYHIGSILVEGGRRALNSFLKQGLFDSVYRTTGPLLLGEGIPAPESRLLPKWNDFNFHDSDRIDIFESKIPS